MTLFQALWVNWIHHNMYSPHHRRRVLSRVPISRNLLFGEKRAKDTGGLSSSMNVLRHAPVATLHRRHRPS
jgi:hypothetical protein